MTMAAPSPETPTPRRTWEIWIYLALALAAVQLALRGIAELRLGLVGAYCWGAAIDLVPIAAAALAVVGLIASILHRPFWRASRVLGFFIVASILASPWMFTRYPSSHDTHPSAVVFRLPLDGPITVGWGGASSAENYHAYAPEQRWAYDLLVTRGGRSHKGEGKALRDYYVYGQPVLAPADGVVVETFDDDPDANPGELGRGTTPAGNHIVIEVAPGEYLWLCHLKPGSLAVTAGDHVAQGQEIAKVGNSGNTSEPHVHIHLQDSTDPDFSEGVPLPFHHYRVDGQLVERGIPRGGIRADGTFVGQVVENVAMESKLETRSTSATPR
jgi:murein DD-endopeptidase MepM/ murein hydrolase activator NlpD